MRIHAFHDNHACGRIRILMPMGALRDYGGHEVTVSYGWGEAARNEPALAAELLVAQRISRIEGSALWRRLKFGRTLVYEIDDDLWHIDPANAGAYLQHGLAAQDASEAAILASDLVTVSTEPLADVVRPMNPNVVVLPNHIDAAMLEIVRPRRDRLVIGWAGGGSHTADLRMIVPTLKRFLNQHPEAELHTIGTDFLGFFKLKGRHTRWQEELFDLYRRMDFDIALAPIVDTVFNRSKSGIKAMEAMALGIPVIASDLEPYRGIVEHGVTGFLVRRQHEWMGYMRELAADADLRERMGMAGRHAVRKWTIQSGWGKWQTAYQKALHPAPARVI